MANISEETKKEITETAVMQSISENKFVVEWFNEHPGEKPTFQDILDAHPKTSNADMQILRDFASTHDASKYTIEDCTSFGEGNGRSVLVSNGNNAYVAFNGTDHNGWIDNGQGMYMESTKLQRDAADRFDYYCEEYKELMKSENNIVVTGHSKGGNKAMYVTMSAKNSYLIDSCIALDGQGFSKAAIDKWQKEYSPDVYNDKISKITLVAGKNDFVNQLGIPIAGTKYYVDYEPWHEFKGNIIDKVKGWLGSNHAHDSMFVRGEDGHLTYDFDCKPGAQDAILRQFMSEYMKLDPAEIEGSAPQLMTLFELLNHDENPFVAADGEVILPSLTGVLWALSKTTLGKGLIALILPWMMAQWPALSGALAAYVIQLGLRMIRNEVLGPKTSDTGSSAGKQEILLNVETFNDLNSSFEIAFEKAIEAAQYAEKAEQVQHNLNFCGSLSRDISKKSEDIEEIMRRVIDSFTKTDAENAKAARAIGEAYLGADMYSSVMTTIQTPPELAEQGIYYR